MKRNLLDVEVVFSYFSKADALREAGYQLFSMSKTQPEGISLLPLTSLFPSDFCMTLKNGRRMDKAITEYRRNRSAPEVLDRIENMFKESTAKRIAILCWKKDPSDNSFRATATKILNRHFKFKVPAVELGGI